MGLDSGKCPPPRRPAAIEEIRAPAHFSPSSFFRLEQCGLSVLGIPRADNPSVNGLLVPHPTSFLGIALHHARQELLEGRWGAATDPLTAAELLVSKALTEIESEIAQDQNAAALLPLGESVGRRVWRSRLLAFYHWARTIDAGCSEGSPRRLVLNSSRRNTVKSDPGVAGPERRLQLDSLRLAGRPDWFAELDGGYVEVVDYKTGRMTDQDGQVLSEHVAQLQLYALLVESKLPGREIQLFVEGAERLQIPWDERCRDEILERLECVSLAYPEEHLVRARSIANPGVHCAQCRLRAMCSVYAEVVPRWWKNEQENPRPLPLDVWGTISRIETGSSGIDVWINDAIGRKVRVAGLNAERGVQNIGLGETVWFFDLEASEDLCQHGAHVQPRNFHEYSSDRRHKAARRLRVFSEQPQCQ